MSNVPIVQGIEHFSSKEKILVRVQVGIQNIIEYLFMNKKYSKEELEKYIFVDNLSYEKIGEMYNVTGNAIKKAALRYGFELPQRRQKIKMEQLNMI